MHECSAEQKPRNSNPEVFSHLSLKIDRLDSDSGPLFVLSGGSLKEEENSLFWIDKSLTLSFESTNKHANLLVAYLHEKNNIFSLTHTHTHTYQILLRFKIY